MALASRGRIFLETIKFEHSVFALPFAYMGALLAVNGDLSLWQGVWLAVAMVGARTFAMGVNRLVDREIDRRNPRTAGRALAVGALKEREVLIFSGAALALFLVAVFQFQPIIRYLWPVVVFPFILYPYTKRFTWITHFVLGFCLGMAPVGAWMAIRGALAWPVLALGFGVLFWTAGFDIIYACQDVAVDRAQRLFSVPARFGIVRALRVTRALHVLAVALFALAGMGLGLGPVYFAGVGLTALLLAYENWLVRPDDLSKVNAAFFTTNGFVSFVLLVFTILDLVLRG